MSIALPRHLTKKELQRKDAETHIKALIQASTLMQDDPACAMKLAARAGEIWMKAHL